MYRRSHFLCLAVTLTVTTVCGDGSTGAGVDTQAAAADMANTAMGGIVKQGHHDSTSNFKLSGNDEQLADMNMKLQEAFMDKVRHTTLGLGTMVFQGPGAYTVFVCSPNIPLNNQLKFTGCIAAQRT